jgi:hypothetical protein
LKPKDALVKDGFLPPGSEKQRGRLSGAAIDRCKELAGQGWDIEGYSVTVSSDSTAATVVQKVKADPNAVVDIPNPTRDETAMTAWAGDVNVGMRKVCNNCRRSLTYCPCPQPRVWVDHETQAVVHFRQL